MRKLTTILAMDVVGYSGLMASDEEGTLATLRRYRETIEDLIGKHRGRVFKTAGDAWLAEFGSAVEAVRCAISIQEDLAVRNAELSQDRQMRFRIGINVGDVMIEGDDLFGDGVNVAARLEGLAEPGGICISGSTFEQVKNKLSIGFEDTGPKTVKNIPHPVNTFRIVPASVSVASKSGTETKARRRRRLLTAAAAAVLIVLGGTGVFFWEQQPAKSIPIASLPANFSTESMPAAQIAGLMTGMRINGKTIRGDMTFVMNLKAGGLVDLDLARGGALQGSAMHDSGKWWAKDNSFCMQFTRFARGRIMCPIILRDGNKLSALRQDGEPLKWELYK